MQVGTTSLDAVNEVIEAHQAAARLQRLQRRRSSALKYGQVDAIVVDLPTALYLRDAEVDGSTVVGPVRRPPAATTGAWC